MIRHRRTPLPSAQQIDPLSWFTGPVVPLSLSVLVFTYSTALVAINWGATERPWLQIIAILLCTSTGIIVHWATRPTRQPLPLHIGALAIGASVAGMLLSALGYSGSRLAVEFWWAPSSLSLAIATLAPYANVRRVLLLGVPASLVAVLGSLAVLINGGQQSSAVGVALMMAYPPLLGLAATAVFSHTVATTMLDMLQDPSQTMAAGRTEASMAAVEAEQVVVRQLTSRTVPFLQSIIASGRISPADRALAGHLARRLRDDLVTQANISWLDFIAKDSRLVVIDPDQRARRLNHAQRTALRGMLRGILDIPGTDRGSLVLQLRGGSDGSTAVGVSLDMALPEGMRIMHLAPYYLTLKSTVDELTIVDSNPLRLSFTIDASDSRA